MIAAEIASEHIAEIARQILGEPNPKLSTRSQLRDGNNGSLSIELDGKKRGLWHDHERGEGGNAYQFVERFANLAEEETVADWLVSKHFASRRVHSQIVATYDYRDEAGKLLFQVIRLQPKSFRQRHPDGKGGGSGNKASA